MRLLTFGVLTLLISLSVTCTAVAQQFTGNPQTNVSGSLQPTGNSLQPTTSGEVLGLSINQRYHDAANNELKVDNPEIQQAITDSETPFNNRQDSQTTNRITLIGGSVGSLILIAFIAKALAGRNKGNIFTS